LETHRITRRIVALAGLYLAAALCAPCALQRESLAPEATLRSFDRYNSRGLPQSTVSSFAQDNEGVLWIGTIDGLARFDGTEIVEVATPPNEPSFGYVIDLVARKRGGMNVVGSGGVYIFDGKDWSLGTLKETVVSLAEDQRNRLWAVDQHGKVWRNTSLPSGGWEPVAMPEGMGRAFKIVCNGEDDAWVVSSQSLTHVVGNNLVPVPPFPEANAKFTALCADLAGGCWIGNQAGEVWHLAPGRGGAWAQVGGAMIDGGPVMTLAMDRRQRLWCGTSAGKVAFAAPGGEWTVWGPENGLNSVAGVLALFADREGTIWIGENAQGAQQFISEAWTHRTRWDGAASQRTAVVASGLAPTLDGGLLAGVNGYGLWQWENGRMTQYGAPQGLPGAIRCVAEPERGVIWAAGRGGIYESRDGGTFHLAFELPLGVVNALRPGPDGKWYALTTTSGIFQQTGGAWAPAEALNAKLPDLNAKSIVWRENGETWVGTMRGLTVYRDGRATLISQSDNAALPTPVLCILEAGPEELLVGGTGGIAAFTSGHWRSFAAPENLPGSTIYALAKGPDGSIWATGGAGVARLKDGQWTKYDSHNGLLNDECNSNGLVVASDGTVCVATMGGLARFDPKSESLPAAELSLYWRSRPEPGADGLGRLARGVRSVNLAWSAPWLAPTPVEFRTRVTPLSREWSQPTRAHDLNFANIGPGAWTVEVQARLEGSGAGGWTPPIVSRFLVPPYFWETVWAPILAGIGAVALTMVIWNLRSRRVRRRQLELQLAVAEAQANVRTLRGLIPICASCKNIRDDRGAWNRLEAYVQQNSEAAFSHGICPACAPKYFPNLSPDGDYDPEITLDP
jgi:ligand-binding sensor domain-containing protein